MNPENIHYAKDNTKGHLMFDSIYETSTVSKIQRPKADQWVPRAREKGNREFKVTGKERPSQNWNPALVTPWLLIRPHHKPPTNIKTTAVWDSTSSKDEYTTSPPPRTSL